MIILSPAHADEIRNDERFSFDALLYKMFLGDYSGLEPLVFGTGFHGVVFKSSVRKNLTQSLEWSEVKFVQTATITAARLSNRVFLGEELSRDKDWLNVSIMYTVDSAEAVQELRMVPSFARGLVHWFMPSMNRCRQHIRTARRLINPEVSTRQNAIRDASLTGKAWKKPVDSLEWFMDNAGGKSCDYALGQIALGLAAIHTTSAMIVGMLYDLAEHPEFMEEVRQEIATVLKEDGGWKKTSLYKMKLLDSGMKESQRLHPITSTLVNRVLTEDVVLKDGTRLPKGAMVAIPSIAMVDPAVFGEDADRFDGRRFLRLREQPGQENRWQFVTTSPEMFGFGHGMHACPGRFFASNEVKIAIAHLILKYDWKFDDKLPRPQSMKDNAHAPNPEAGIWCRARNPELAL
ncbi:Cytochrome p450 protein [Lasiodiplodia theobromae]|uniref:Cytochrome p450 protein n=1 Tax=Lasiodiplodia theobromae TaxID=45133 RepID=UPI0015C3D6F2|nr:Cytochrome p450 protein [Lasiodiplodia theobromae]KAF4536404.1 Cytochrome p450 protein [Lasiodiplodia theobromae]